MNNDTPNATVIASSATTFFHMESSTRIALRVTKQGARRYADRHCSSSQVLATSTRNARRIKQSARPPALSTPKPRFVEHLRSQTNRGEVKKTVPGDEGSGARTR